LLSLNLKRKSNAENRRRENKTPGELYKRGIDKRSENKPSLSGETRSLPIAAKSERKTSRKKKAVDFSTAFQLRE